MVIDDMSLWLCSWRVKGGIGVPGSFSFEVVFPRLPGMGKVMVRELAPVKEKAHNHCICGQNEGFGSCLLGKERKQLVGGCRCCVERNCRWS
jgi:hypothetical protein